jgi:hypothetical protein
MVAKRDEGFPTEDIRGLFNGTHVSFFKQNEVHKEDSTQVVTIEDDKSNTVVGNEEEVAQVAENEVTKDVSDDSGKEDELEFDETKSDETKSDKE